MKQNGILYLMLLFIFSVIVVGCSRRTTTSPSSSTEINSNTIQTAAAQTLVALGTQPPTTSGDEEQYHIFMPSVFNSIQGSENQSGGPYPIESLTATPTTTPTHTPKPTATKIPNTPTPITPTPAPCLAAKFIQHINVPPGTVFTGGTKFTKIWRVQNVGSCPWYSNYTLVLVSGDGIGGGSDVPINATVAPGQTVDILIDLTAPKNNGKYKSAWMLYNLAGQVFGVGDKATDYLWVEIKVVNAATATSKSSKATATSKPKATTAPTSTNPPTATNTPIPSLTNTEIPLPTDIPPTSETPLS